MLCSLMLTIRNQKLYLVALHSTATIFCSPLERRPVLPSGFTPTLRQRIQRPHEPSAAQQPPYREWVQVSQTLKYFILDFATLISKDHAVFFTSSFFVKDFRVCNCVCFHRNYQTYESCVQRTVQSCSKDSAQFIALYLLDSASRLAWLCSEDYRRQQAKFIPLDPNNPQQGKSKIYTIHFPKVS